MGPDHPGIAGILTNLGAVIGILGEYEKACSMLERALKMQVTAMEVKGLSEASLA